VAWIVRGFFSPLSLVDLVTESKRLTIIMMICKQLIKKKMFMIQNVRYINGDLNLNFKIIAPLLSRITQYLLILEYIFRHIHSSLLFSSILMSLIWNAKSLKTEYKEKRNQAKSNGLSHVTAVSVLYFNIALNISFYLLNTFSHDNFVFSEVFNRC
jgi:hypothetical protein